MTYSLDGRQYVVIPAGSDADEAALTLSRGSGHDEARGGA